MTGTQRTALLHARKALLVARVRCLPPGYYPDTMSARLSESSKLLDDAVDAAVKAAEVLDVAGGPIGLASLLHEASKNRMFILRIQPAEVEDLFNTIFKPSQDAVAAKEETSAAPPELND